MMKNVQHVDILLITANLDSNSHLNDIENSLNCKIYIIAIFVN